MGQVDLCPEVLAVQVVLAQHLDLPKSVALTAFVLGFITLRNPSAVCLVLHPTSMISDENLAVCGPQTGSEVFL